MGRLCHELHRKAAVELIRGLLLCLLAISPVVAQQQSAPWPAQAQALLDQARRANPQRVQLALDEGVRLYPTTDGRAFWLVWYPPGAPQRNHPLVVSLHGSTSWAFDEFALWQQSAAEFGYGIVALQWWFGGPEGPEAYYSPDALHRELRAALRMQEAGPGSALLHGFSRGASNIYGVTALDRRSGDSFYSMTLANSGGASVDFPPNVAISRGDFGFNALSGTYWAMFCGGRDPNPDRDGCPAMRRTSSWVEQYGGVTSLFIQDDSADHGGFHQTPAHIRSALTAFRDNLAARRRVLPVSRTQWEVRRDPSFEIAGGSVSNVGWVNGEVWLTAATPRAGMRLYRSRDGSNSQDGAVIPGLGDALQGTGFNPGEVVPREGPNGRPELYVLGLAGPGQNRAVVFRLRAGDNGPFTRQPSAPVYSGSGSEGEFLGVPDITPTLDGGLRLSYVALGATRQNSRTAISTDGGASFTPEFTNPFGDFALQSPRPTDTNVDPALLKLAGGAGYLAVGMRGGRFFLFSSVDGVTFVPAREAAIEAPQIAPGDTALFDPTLVQLPDGRIWMYATGGSITPTGGSRIIRAELIPTVTPMVRNAASAQTGIAAGSLISVFGRGLGGSVTLSGKALDVIYASEDQINAYVPADATSGELVAAPSAAVTLKLDALAPALFGTDRASVAAGETVDLIFTGYSADVPLSATMAGRDAKVVESGVLPGVPGAACVRLAVPAGIPTGQADIVLTLGGVASNAIAVAVLSGSSSTAGN